MISNSEVEKIAGLAHLQFKEDELPALAAEMRSILDYVKQLDMINAAEVEPMSHVHGIVNVYREDTAAPGFSIEELFRNAPDCSERFIRVPIILE